MTAYREPVAAQKKIQINCKGCDYCGPDRKAKIDGKRATVEDDRLKIAEGPESGKDAYCPPEHRIPIGAPEVEEPKPFEEICPPPVEPPPKIRDFGYGPACERCHATRGECHSEDCPLSGEKVA